MSELHKKPELPKKEMELSPGPFGDLFLSPHDLDLGEEPGRRIEVKDLRIQLGEKPIARNLQKLYQASHPKFPKDVMVYDNHDIWLITHVIGAINPKGMPAIKILGYQADFENKDQVYTIDLFPRSEFKTKLGASLTNEFDLSIEGNAQLPDNLVKLMEAVEFLGGDARLKLSSALRVIGRASFSIKTSLIQAVGIASSRCEWCFQVDDTPLLGDQIILQTVLVPKYTEILKFKIRGYAMVKTNWISFPALFRTEWLEVECKLV